MPAFFPSRWRRWHFAFAAALALGAANSALVTSSTGVSRWVGSVAFALGSAGQLRAGRRSGVTLDERGLTVRSFGWLGANGTWAWEALQGVEVFTDEHVRNGSPQLGVQAVDGELIRLGRADGQAALVAALQARLP